MQHLQGKFLRIMLRNTRNANDEMHRNAVTWYGAYLLKHCRIFVTHSAETFTDGP